MTYVFSVFQYTQSKDGSTVGVTVTRKAMLCHAQTLTLASNYTEGKAWLSLDTEWTQFHICTEMLVDCK